MKIYLQIFAVLFVAKIIKGCHFQPAGEYLRFVRVPENLPVGGEVLQVQVYPRNNLHIRPVDKEDDMHYFSYRDVNKTTVAVLLAKSLEDLVDRDSPQNVLKFRLSCDYIDGEDTVTSYLSVTVYVEDINDHSPKFIDAPYQVTIDELTPTGLTIFRGILATDRDKPNTPNSDVQYSIIGGNEKGKFSLENSHRPALQIRRSLDYDTGDRTFTLTISASDRGVPPKSSNTTVTIYVTDNDDLPPKFTKGVYRTKITEFYPIKGTKIHEKLKFEPPIYAFDQDLAIDAKIRYDIIAGNDRRLFSLDPHNGSLFLEKEIDLDQERTLPGNTFVLQIQAAQVDNPLKTGVARVEVEILDLNDNLPEFEVDFYNISIVENLPNGFSVLQVIATDQDQGDNGEFTYILQDTSGAFDLDSRTGWLTVRDQTILDREKRSTLQMRVLAKEKAPSVVTDKQAVSFVSIEVTLLDANDNNPSFIPSNLYEFTITPSARIGDLVGTVKAVDPDLGRNGIVLYEIQHGSINSSTSRPNLFTVEPKSGRILVNEDQLHEGRYVIFVEASDQPSNPSERRFSLAVVTVDVIQPGNKDISEEIPDFIGAPYEFWVGANAGIGTSIGQIRVTDAFNKNNIIYDLLHSYAEGVPFAVEERSGVITVVDELSKFDKPLYDFEAVVTDDTDVTLVTNVSIHVVDPQDEKGILMKGTNLSPIEFTVRENHPGAIIGRLIHKNTSFLINNSSRSLRFVIANQQDVTDDIAISQDGTLYAIRALDREKRDVYRITVIAQYIKGVLSGAGIYQVTVHVEDENDNAPQFSQSSYEGTIKENSISGTEVMLNHPIKATDLDTISNAQITFTLFGDGSEKFRIDKHTGRVYFISGDSPLDREKKPSYNMRLVASDQGGLRSEVKLRIIVLDENDNAPEIKQIEMYQNLELLNPERTGISIKNSNLKSNKPFFKISEHVENPILKIIAEDKDSKNSSDITYKITSKSQFFSINPTSGEITVIKKLPAEAELFLNISAIDSGGFKDTLTLKFFVEDQNDHAPVFKKSFYNFNIEEGNYKKRVLGKVEALDEDFGPNSNISYHIEYVNKLLPFFVSEFDGILTINGELDRESKDKYNFKVTARDNPKNGSQLNSSVEIEINILDVNDNAPNFYGFDEILRVPPPGAKIIPNHNFDASLPIYYANIAENTPVGTPITRVFANDSDFPGNGNGLIIFDVPLKKDKSLFAVDSKDGVVTTVGRLDYEVENMHNVTIVAKDLGSPSRSSSALVMVSVIDVPDDSSVAEVPVFAHRYYEVELEENTPVPTKLLSLNVTEPYKSHRLRYTLVPTNDTEIPRHFKVDPRNGTVYVIASPDRETRSGFRFKIRLDRIKLGRGMPVMVYPITSEKLSGLALNEVKIVVRITDVNDNVPKFTFNGRPIVAAIPTSANYGHHIVKLEAFDPDEGLNGDIRYQILGRASDDSSHRFTIDAISGQVRSIASFATDAGRVFGFDVKATDRQGADDGRSSIANVFVYVIDERKQLVMVMGAKPTEVEKSMDNIMTALYNATGYDIRVRKLEPHSDRNFVDYSATDMFLYAVDPHLNVIVDMDHLQKILRTKMSDIECLLSTKHRVLDISSGIRDRGLQSRSQRFLLSSLEVGVVVLGCVVFVGALATALCVVCIRKNRRNNRHPSQTSPLSYTIASTNTLKPTLFPTPYDHAIHYTEPTDSYLTVIPTSGRAKQRHQHNRSCVRFHGRKVARKANGVPLENSVTSLHSSGKDSGIVDGNLDQNGRCQCGFSSTHSSDDSSTSSYEDSLKSMSPQKPPPHHPHTLSHSRHSSRSYFHRRNRSFPEVQDSPIIHRVPIHHETQMNQLSHHSAVPGFKSQSNLARKSSERLIIACPGNVSISS